MALPCPAPARVVVVPNTHGWFEAHNGKPALSPLRITVIHDAVTTLQWNGEDEVRVSDLRAMSPETLVDFLHTLIAYFSVESIPWKMEGCTLFTLYDWIYAIPLPELHMARFDRCKCDKWGTCTTITHFDEIVVVRTVRELFDTVLEFDEHGAHIYPDSCYLRLEPVLEYPSGIGHESSVSLPTMLPGAIYVDYRFVR